MNEGRKKIIRERVQIMFLPLIRDGVSAGAFNETVEEVVAAVERQWDGGVDVIKGEAAEKFPRRTAIKAHDVDSPIGTSQHVLQTDPHRSYWPASTVKVILKAHGIEVIE